MRILLLIFISLNCASDISFGEIEELIFKSDYDERKIQIYFPNNKIINNDTTFIIMNDGEELFNAGDSWHNKEWGIDNLGIIGASMGGLSALNALLENPEKFKFAGCISTHWVGIKPSSYLLLPITQNVYGDKNTTNAIIKYVEQNIGNLDNQKVYFDHGTEGLDSLYEVPQKKVDSIFEENAKEFKSLIFEGEDHDAPFFGGRIDYVLNYLMN